MNKIVSPVYKIFVIQTAVIFGLYFLMRFFLDVGADSFSWKDDGYFRMGYELYFGLNPISGRVLGPLLGIIYTPVFIFPDYLYPVARLLIAQIFTLGNLIFVFLILSRVFIESNERKINYIYFGLLGFALNPLYVYFTLKPTPELYITFFLLGTLFFSLKYLSEYRMIYIFLCIVFYGLSIFIKPVLCLIPALFFLYFLFKRKIKLSLVFLIVNIFNLVFFYSYIKFTEAKHDEKSINYSNIDYAYINYTYLVRDIIQTRDFSTGTKIESGNREEQRNTIAVKELKEFVLENGENGFLKRNINFIKKETAWFVVARILSPLFFFSLYSTTKYTVLFLFLNLFIILTGLTGMKKTVKENDSKDLVEFILITLIGYIMIFMLTYSYVRYAVPVVSVLSAFSCIAFYHYYMEKKIKKEKIVDN